MKKVTTLFLFTLFIVMGAFAQTVQSLNKTGSTDISLNIKVNDIGPGGNSSSGLRSNDKVDSIALTGYPKLKNLPDSLSDLKIYTVIKNQLQFDYQNYRNRVYSKQFFLNKYKNYKWLREDTLKLTNRMVKCYFSFAVGYDRANKPKFVIDVNGNNDFGDDELRTFTARIFTLNSELNLLNTLQVAIEYYDGKNVCIEQIPFLLNMSDVQNTQYKDYAVTISIPQYKYTIISYEGRNYYVCTDMNLYYQSVFIFPEEPLFGKVPDKYITKPNQIVKIGNSYFKYETVNLNQNMIRLTAGFSESDMKTQNEKPILPTTIPRPAVTN